MSDPGRYLGLTEAEYRARAEEGRRNGALYLSDADIEAECARIRRHIAMSRMVDRFLSWPLPESVCSDPCVMQGGMRGRVGTNLLTADEARQMLEYVLGIDEVIS
jgi:hypothetical protein